MKGECTTGAKRQSGCNSPAQTPTFGDEAIVKRMKMGLLDPSRAFVRENQVDGLIFEDMDESLVAKSKPKLEKIRLILEKYEDNLFKSVVFSRNGMRLIVRAMDVNGEEGKEAVACEGYCFIHWGESEKSSCHTTHTSKTCTGHSHRPTATRCHAVVQSTSDWLRGEISLALAQIDESAL